MNIRKKTCKSNINKFHNYLCDNNLTDDDVLPHLKAHVAAYAKLNNNRRIVRGYRKYDATLHPPISDMLASIILIITEKILNGPRFKYYSDEWKDDMRTTSHYHLCKYLHNFKQRSGSCLSYIWNGAEKAILWELKKKLKKEHRLDVCSINDIGENQLVAEQEFNVNLI